MRGCARTSSSELNAHEMPAGDDLRVQINTEDDRPYFRHRQERTSHWEMPPGTTSGWVMSRDDLFVHIDTQNVADVDRGHALVQTGATARPGRE